MGEGQDVCAVVGAEVGNAAGVGVAKGEEPAGGGSKAGKAKDREYLVGVLGKGVDPEGKLEHEAVIIGAVLGVGSVGFDLGLQAVVEPFPADGAPAESVGVLGEGQASGIKGGGFAEEMVVVLGAGVKEGRGDAGGVGGDGMPEVGNSGGG